MAWKALLAYILAVGANGLGSLSLGSWFWTSLRDEICGRAWRSTTQHPEQRLSAKVSAFIVRPAPPQKKLYKALTCDSCTNDQRWNDMLAAWHIHKHRHVVKQPQNPASTNITTSTR
jgi:hypothetical protein